jgi:hypothetical protein
MRGSKLAWLLAGVVIGILAFAGVLLLIRGAPAREVRQADGTMIRLEKVSFGKREPFTPGGTMQRLKQALADHLPKKWASRLVSTSTNKTTWNTSSYPAHTNEPALQVWITRIDPANGSYQSVDVRYAEVEDEDGCVFSSTIGGGEDNGLLAPLPATATPARRGNVSGAQPMFGSGPTPTLPPTVPPGAMSGSAVPAGAQRLVPGPGMSVGTTLSGLASTGPRVSVVWFTFEVFPRRDKQFKVRFLDSRRQPLAEFMVDNPVPRPGPVNWTANDLPVTVTNGGVAFTLAELTIRTNTSMIVRQPNSLPQSIAQQRDMYFKFDTVESGGVSQDWDPVSMELWDSSGNHAVKRTYPLPLCPRDPAWKMEVKFVGREDPPASNLTWTISDLHVPASGRSFPIDSNVVLGGVPIKIIGLGGSGRFIYNDGVLTSQSPAENGAPSASLSSSSRGGAGSSTLTATAPHLALNLGQLTEDQRLTVRVTDADGREVRTREYPSSNGGPLRTLGRGRGPDEITYIGPSGRSTARGNVILQRNLVTFILLDGLQNRRASDTTFNVSISLHTTRTVDFTFKPPGQTSGK